MVFCGILLQFGFFIYLVFLDLLYFLLGYFVFLCVCVCAHARMYVCIYAFEKSRENKRVGREKDGEEKRGRGMEEKRERRT